MNIKEELCCHACGKTLDLEANSKILRSDECPYCYAGLHCCKMCGFYDTSTYNECRESNADRILEKEKSNFCDYFVLKGGGGNGGNGKDNLLDAANSLFKS
ncbi:hypothetical protein A9Q84_21565 [Halobacteriovorax marinus]|uniref:Uncharacterized protein n=1 Tax=Halobacteriovorax marinus TaxID=97084 RepID=A0A1Y5F242_9BACT|nr:hypothetical protein A9Q84_21565 [Halobacteriovorax marinus]